MVWALGEAGEARQPALARQLAARRLPGSGERTVGAAGAPPALRRALPARRWGGRGLGPAGRPRRAGRRGPPGGGGRAAGRGEVVLLAGPELLDNRHVGTGRRPLALGEAGGAGTDRLRRAVPAPAAAGRASRGRPAGAPRPAARRLVLLLAAALWPRLGAVRPPPPAGAGRTTREYLASLAGLYRRAGAEPELAAATWQRLRRRLEREAGVAAGAPGRGGGPAAGEPRAGGGGAAAAGRGGAGPGRPGGPAGGGPGRRPTSRRPGGGVAV